MDELNQSLRQRDKVKDDAITQISDQDATSNDVTYIIIIPATKPTIDDKSNQPLFFGNDRSFESASFLGSVFLLLLLFDIHVRIENAT